MIIDINDVLALNETVVTEAVSGDITLLIGALFIFIGILYLYNVTMFKYKSKRTLKRYS